VQQPANLIQFSGLDTATLPDARDLRSMGIGVRRIWLEREAPLSVHAVTAKDIPLPLSLSGVVYASVLNPGDDRKNWLEMLTAFCYAFRDEPRATLLLKMTHRSVGSFLGQFHFMLQRIGPMQCRVVLLHGYLEQASYQQLIAATTFYVNTSHCEGLCLPLMEFMSDGVPALAPYHTAMRDYVSADNAFIIDSGLEPAIWPHDSRHLLRTLRYRLDWQSIVKAYQDSFHLALQAPALYRRMSEHARRAQRDFCAEEIVREKLSSFFQIGAARPTIDSTVLFDGRSAL
jgi:glycosyltransferase involved in cell wall biosynthesis